MEPGYIKYVVKERTKAPSKEIQDKPHPKDTFNVWVTGCSHTLGGVRKGVLPISKAISQSEFGDKHGAHPFFWDIMLHLGDLGSHHDVPNEFLGKLIQEQFTVGKKHQRLQIYNLMGNHDSTPDSNAWFRTWIDPMGENTTISGVDNSKRKFPVEGTYERYKFETGNILFLMLSDRNDFDLPQGRNSSPFGFPAGTVTKATFEWWKEQVENNQDKIIITCHHHMLKNTTVGSGPFEGVDHRFHSPNSPDDAKGSSYLYFVGENADASDFADYLENHPGAIDMWLGAHTHIGPNDSISGRTYCEQKYGTWFVNCAVLGTMGRKTSPQSSRLLNFVNNSNVVNMEFYIHDGKGLFESGYYEPARRTLILSKKVIVPN